MKEVEEDTKKWNDIPCLWTGWINITCPYSKQHTDSKQSIKIPTPFFIEMQQIMLKFVRNHKTPK